MPLSVSERVWRPESVGIVRLKPWEGMAMGASEEHRDASAGRWKPVLRPSSAALCGLRAGGGRTGAVGLTNRVAPRSSGQSHASPPGSTTPLCEGPRRLTRRLGAPQVGQRTASGCGGRRCGGGPGRGGAGTLIRRRVAVGMAPLAWRKPP